MATAAKGQYVRDVANTEQIFRNVQAIANDWENFKKVFVIA